MNKKVIAGLTIIVLLGGGGWWYASRKAARRANGEVKYVQEAVKRGTIRETVTGSGAVRSINGVTVQAAQSGTVVQVLAREGDRVEAGQPVVVLENKEVNASLAQAQLDLQNARTNLANLLNPQETAVRAQELKVESARVTLKQRQDEQENLNVPAPLAGVVASVAAARGASVNAGTLLFTIYDETTPTLILPVPQDAAGHLTYGQKATVTLPGLGTYEGSVARLGGIASTASGNRDASLPVSIDLPPVPGIRPGMVGQATIAVPALTYLVQGQGYIENDATEVRAKVSGTVQEIAVKEGDSVTPGQSLLTIENDSMQVQLQQAENDLKTQEQALAQLLDPSLDPAKQLLAYQQKVQQAELNVSQKQRDVDDLTVRAPVAGTISSLSAVVGDKVSTNASLFFVADYNAMEVTISVDELDVAQIKVGQDAEVTLDALPGKTYKGKVTKVNPEGTFKNEIATFSVTVTIDKPEGLMSGMNATVEVVVLEKRNVLSVPVTAVQVRQGKTMVSVMQDGQVVQKEIQVGTKTDDRYEVVSGLTEGEQVITTTVRSEGTGGTGGTGGNGFIGRPGGSFAPPGGGNGGGFRVAVPRGQGGGGR